MVALRTQQILGYESGVPNAVDPLAGSYFIESLTDRIEDEAMVLIDRIDAKGGAVAAIEDGFQQREIEDAAYAHATAVDSGDATVVGVNRYQIESEGDHDVLHLDPELETNQVAALHERKRGRDNEQLSSALSDVTAAAHTDANILYPLKAALELGATVGETTLALISVFGRYRPSQ